MVITAEVLMTTGVASSLLFLAFADLCFALGPAGAPEHALPIVQAVQPCSFPDSNFQVRDIVLGEQLLVDKGEPVPREVSRDSPLPRKKKI